MIKEDHIEMGDATLAKNSFLGKYVSFVVEEAVEKAIVKTIQLIADSTSKQNLLSSNEIAKKLNCTNNTVIVYINDGHRNAGKLIGFKDGRNYKASEYHLNEFIKRLHL